VTIDLDLVRMGLLWIVVVGLALQAVRWLFPGPDKPSSDEHDRRG
jgi:hypothetical protein